MINNTEVTLEVQLFNLQNMQLFGVDVRTDQGVWQNRNAQIMTDAIYNGLGADALPLGVNRYAMCDQCAVN